MSTDDALHSPRESDGHEPRHRAAHDLLVAPAKEELGPPIRPDEDAIVPRDQHRLGCGVEGLGQYLVSIRFFIGAHFLLAGQ